MKTKEGWEKWEDLFMFKDEDEVSIEDAWRDETWNWGIFFIGLFFAVGVGVGVLML